MPTVEEEIAHLEFKLRMYEFCRKDTEDRLEDIREKIFEINLLLSELKNARDNRHGNKQIIQSEEHQRRS